MNAANSSRRPYGATGTHVPQSSVLKPLSVASILTIWGSSENSVAMTSSSVPPNPDSRSQ